MDEIPGYERDAYARHIDTAIRERGTDERGDYVVLDDTVLYPEGGGQPADRGALGGVSVVDVQRVDGQVRHYVDAAIEAESVTLELDWERRYDHMQQHTAQHLITAIAAARFGWETTSFHLGERRCDIELDTEPPSTARLDELEAAVAAEIRAARPVLAQRLAPQDLDRDVIRSRGLPAGHQGDVRVVEIEGVDRNTCGGTHVARTAEIETVKLLGTESLRGGCRLFWVAGARVRELLATHERRTAELRRVLETADDELVALATKKLDHLGTAERAVRALQGRLAAMTAAELAGREGPVLESHTESADAGFLQEVARALTETAGSRIALLTAANGEGAWFVVAAGPECDVDVATVGPRIAEALEGRGGGRGSIFQGKAGSLHARAKAIEVLSEAMGGPSAVMEG